MDGAKHDTDTIGILFSSIAVSRRLFRVEAFSKERVERKGMRILAEVRSNLSENERCRKGKVSSAITINRGLVSS